MLDEFRQQRKIHVRFAFQIVMDILALLQTLPTLVDITIPDGASFTVCGVSLRDAWLPSSPPIHHATRMRIISVSLRVMSCTGLRVTGTTLAGHSWAVL